MGAAGPCVGTAESTSGGAGTDAGGEAVVSSTGAGVSDGSIDVGTAVGPTASGAGAGSTGAGTAVGPGNSGAGAGSTGAGAWEEECRDGAAGTDPDAVRKRSSISPA